DIAHASVRHGTRGTMPLAPYIAMRAAGGILISGARSHACVGMLLPPDWRHAPDRTTCPRNVEMAHIAMRAAGGNLNCRVPGPTLAWACLTLKRRHAPPREACPRKRGAWHPDIASARGGRHSHLRVPCPTLAWACC